MHEVQHKIQYKIHRMCSFDRQFLFSIQKPSVTELLELLVLYRRKK